MQKHTRLTYLGRVRIDDPDVDVRMGPLEHNLLHVASEDPVRRQTKLHVDEIQELVDVPEQLVADTLAGGVDAAFQVGYRKDHGSCKHTDTDGLAKSIYAQAKK